MSVGSPGPHPDPDGRVDDPSIVPGVGSGRTLPLDPSKDPDRFDPIRVQPVPEMPRNLDPDYDPDRFSVVGRSSGQGKSLPDLLGTAGTHEGRRDNYEWAYGLVAILVFLGLVSFLFNSVLSP